MKESYAVQACERAAAALARRRKDMVADRIIGAAIQGQGNGVKSLPVLGNDTPGVDFIKAAPGSVRGAVGKPVYGEKLSMGYLE